MAIKPMTSDTSAPPAAPDGATPITLTFDQLKELLQGSGNTGALGALSAQISNGVIQSHPNPPLISAFNPEGELARPRPHLIGTYFWLNTRLQAEELTREEIDLLNAVTPGAYGPMGAWQVENLSPGMGRPADRKIQIVFPNKDPDHRASLPSMVAMLRQIVDEQSSVLA